MFSTYVGHIQWINKTKQKKKKKSTLQINKTLLMETSLSLPYLFSN